MSHIDVVYKNICSGLLEDYPNTHTTYLHTNHAVLLVVGVKLEHLFCFQLMTAAPEFRLFIEHIGVR